MTHLVTYATPDMSISADILKQSAKANGVDKVYQWGRAALEQTEFYSQNKEILDTPRGSGLWCWKSYIILDLMQRLPDGDIVIYTDAGVEIVAPVQNIINRMRDDIWLFGNMWQHLHWCKADCWVPILGNDYYGYEGKQIQASVIFIRNGYGARMFVEQWLKLCCEKQMIDDTPSRLPNHPEFMEHRHDQAIICCMAIKHRYPLHWWPAMYNAGNFTYERTGYPASDNYPIMFHHHRRRNEEWTLTDPLNQYITNYFKRKYQNLPC